MKRWTQVCSLVLFAVVLGGVLMPLGAQPPFDQPMPLLGVWTKVLLLVGVVVLGFFIVHLRAMRREAKLLQSMRDIQDHEKEPSR